MYYHELTAKNISEISTMVGRTTRYFYKRRRENFCGLIKEGPWTWQNADLLKKTQRRVDGLMQVEY